MRLRRVVIDIFRELYCTVVQRVGSVPVCLVSCPPLMRCSAGWFEGDLFVGVA